MNESNIIYNIIQCNDNIKWLNKVIIIWYDNRNGNAQRK